MDKTNLIKLTKDAYSLTLLFPKREPLRQKIREVADDILASLIASGKNDPSAIYDQLAVMDAFLDVAGSQNWVAGLALEAVKNAYFSLNSQNKILEDKAKNQEASQIKPRGQITNDGIIYAPVAFVPPLIGNLAAEEPQFVASDEFAFSPGDIATQPKNEEKILADEASQEKEELTQGQIKRQNRIIEYLKEKCQAQVWEIQKIFPAISKRTIRRDFRSLLKQGLIERVGERNRTYYKLKVNIA